MSEVITVHITCEDISYPIVIGSGILDTIKDHVRIDAYSSVFVLTDPATRKYGDAVMQHLPIESTEIFIDADERHKTIETVEKVWESLHSGGADRKSLLINVGGGVLSDMGSFAAATFMRGIDFVNVPTTLLAASDASIGGKTGVNFAGLKNMLGTFTQPQAVIIDVTLFKTLESRLFREGLGEVIKHGAIADKQFFDWLEERVPNLSEDDLLEMLHRSCSLKASVVAGDERESDRRREVNFGHTIGHAIEALSHQYEPILHGEAVAIGMVAEASLGELLGITDSGTSEELKAILLKAGLPIALPEWLTYDMLIEKVKRDKKTLSNSVQWTLIPRIGEVKTGQLIEDELLRNLFNH